PPPRAGAAAIAMYRRRLRSAARDTGVSRSQKPPAADASTGPKSRLAARAVATASANDAQGSTARADRQESAVHPATTRCALKMTLTIIAPIIRAAITAM